MDTRQLTEAILEGGIRSIKFFNGRLLTGEDLSSEQAANREARARLGQAIGDGVAYGLEVERTPNAGASPLVSVAPGQALNRKGQALKLTAKVDLLLSQPNLSASAASAFDACLPPRSSVYVAGAGVYLLTIGPASGVEGRVPVSGLGESAAPCNTRYQVEGVQFRLIQLEMSSEELSDVERLRNLVAYRCFGADDLQALRSDFLGPALSGYGLLDRLRPNTLTDCDVPLAVLHWTAGNQIRFVDNWAARRRLTRASIAGNLGAVMSDRRLSEAEAMLLQFADQIEAVRASTANPESVVVTGQFRYLPPIGFLPLTGAGVRRGFNYKKFFEGRVYAQPVFIEGARLEPLVRRALAYPPLDLLSGEMVWLYEVRENRDSRAFVGAAAPLPFLIFVSGHVPFFAEARFDVSRWDYSNYTSALALP